MIKASEKICKDCGKLGTICKDLCKSCYQKKHRGSPEGRLKVKLYNDTKGREAKARYFAKQPPKPPRPPKVIKICECERIAIVKGLCSRCYQRKRNGVKSEDYRDRRGRLPVIDIEKVFNYVLSELQKGQSITSACNDLGISRNVIYNRLSGIQRTELRAAKAIGAINGNQLY